MECERATVLLSGMIDSALGPIARFRVHRHVAGCNACAARFEELRAMQSAIRTKLPYHRAPPGLAARIGAALPREEPPRAVRPWFHMPAFSLAGTGLAGALAGVALTVMVMGGQNNPTMSVIDSHIRSLQADHLTDVTDQRSAHGEAVAVGATGCLSAGARTEGRGISIGRREAGLHRWPSCSGGGVSAREARNQPVRVGVFRSG